MCRNSLLHEKCFKGSSRLKRLRKADSAAAMGKDKTASKKLQMADPKYSKFWGIIQNYFKKTLKSCFLINFCKMFLKC